MSAATFQQTVEFDPAMVQQIEALWFQPAGDAPLLPRAVRLTGFDTEQPRIGLDSLVGADLGRRCQYVDRRAAIVRRHGGAVEIAVESVATMYGVFAPDLLCLSAWPNEGSLAAFESDPALHSLRVELAVADVTSTWAQLHPVFHAAPHRFDMCFDARSTYELCALWNSATWTPDNQQAFLESTAPSRARHHAGAGLVLVPTSGEYLPNLLCLSEWPTLEDFAGFVTDPEHVEVSRKRGLAFSRMDATATRLFRTE